MNFTELIFLFGFLPLSWLIYSLFATRKNANRILFAASLVFAAWHSGYALCILLAVLAVTWFATRTMENLEDDTQRKNLLYATGGLYLLILFVYKYMPVWFSFLSVYHDGTPAALLMPAGLSYYLFSCASCLFDVYTRKAPAPDSFIDLSIYAAFFARLNMGPIANWASDRAQLSSHPQTPAKSRKGVLMFVQGLFMKVMIADAFMPVCMLLEGDASVLGAILLPIANLLRLYFDFAGYSRMARGIGSLFGFDIAPNFDYPLCAQSVTEFWRCWHISLTDWFREYIYIPLGGNRVPFSRWMFNIFCVWLVTGLWHGATLHFIVWGLLEGVLLVFEKNVLASSLEKWPKVLRHIYVLISQLLVFSFFNAASTGAALGALGRMVGIQAEGLISNASLFALWSAPLLWIAAIVSAAKGTVLLGRVCSNAMSTQTYRRVQIALYILAFVVCLGRLMSADALVFFYAAF